MCVLQTALAQRNQELQVMVDQAASRPQSGHADSTAPFLRVDLREETVTEKAQPGMSLAPAPHPCLAAECCKKAVMSLYQAACVPFCSCLPT